MEKILSTICLIKGYCTRNSTREQTNNSIKKWAEALNRNFSKEDQLVYEKHSTFPTTRKMQIKATILLYLLGWGFVKDKR
jgi:hypothetical protein